MKRAQIKRHRLTWLLMTPVLAAIIICAMMVKPSTDGDANSELPAFLTEEMR